MLLNSDLFKDSYGMPEMRAVFEDRRLIECYIEVEVALARAEAKVGIIPETAARVIAEKSRFEVLDLDRLKRDTQNVGYPILPLVKQLSAACGESGKYLHWGATTQDIMDTALILQLREAFGLISVQLKKLRGSMADLAQRYKDSPLAGRTHLQHALPITFGFKMATWLSMLDRHSLRLEQLLPRLLVGEFAGAAGTLASLGDKGLEVQAAMMKELGLGVPDMTWHVARDNLAEAVLWLGMLTASLGKMALDIMVMMATELAEVFEPFTSGRGASSTMPQKRNPISCEIISAAAKVVRQHCAVMLDAMVQDFERGTGPWQAEWIAIPESFVLTAGALSQANFLTEGLEVDEERMLQNLDLTRGLISSEAIMMRLAPHTGRQQAHDIVYAACRKATETATHLGRILAADAQVTRYLSQEEITHLLDPKNYVGLAPVMTSRYLELRA